MIPENAVKPITMIGLLLALLSTWSFEALAQRKTDVVTLYNGDRITGEIKGLLGGILKLSTDAMGTLNIEWQEVSHLESDYYYEVRLSKGTRHFGSVAKSLLPGHPLRAETSVSSPLDPFQDLDPGIESPPSFPCKGDNSFYHVKRRFRAGKGDVPAALR